MHTLEQPIQIELRRIYAILNLKASSTSKPEISTLLEHLKREHTALIKIDDKFYIDLTNVIPGLSSEIDKISKPNISGLHEFINAIDSPDLNFCFKRDIHFLGNSITVKAGKDQQETFLNYKSAYIANTVENNTRSEDYFRRTLISNSKSWVNQIASLKKEFINNIENLNLILNRALQSGILTPNEKQEYQDLLEQKFPNTVNKFMTLMSINSTDELKVEDLSIEQLGKISHFFTTEINSQELWRDICRTRDVFHRLSHMELFFETMSDIEKTFPLLNLKIPKWQEHKDLNQRLLVLYDETTAAEKLFSFLTRSGNLSLKILSDRQLALGGNPLSGDLTFNHGVTLPQPDYSILSNLTPKEAVEAIKKL